MSNTHGILILGGTGFVGRQLIERLITKKLEVYVISRSAHTLPEHSNLHKFTDSMDNCELLENILPHCHTVFHLASDSTPSTSSTKPSFEISNNLMPTLRFLETLHHFKDRTLIYFSSGGAIYGNSNSDLVKENEPLNPLSYYGAGKASIEKFIIAFCQQTQHSAIILRPSNFYGPEQPFRKGFGVIPTIFHHLINQKELVIWGDGSNTRDYLYISDTIDLCLALIKQPYKSHSTQIYNLGFSEGTSLNHLCNLVEEISQKNIIRRYVKPRSVDVKSIVLDCTHLQADYQWCPKIDLKTGLELTWEWFKQNKW